MKTQTLLEKARCVPTASSKANNVTEEELDLLIALMNGDITVRQAAAALNKKHPTAVVSRCYSLLRAAIQRRAVARIVRSNAKNGKA